MRITPGIAAFAAVLFALPVLAQDKPAPEPAATTPVTVEEAPTAEVPEPEGPFILIRGAEVHTVGDAGTLRRGDVLISGSRIAAVGINLPTPNGAEVIDATGRIVTPGFMTSYSQLGITEIELVRETADVEADEEIAEAAFDVADAINPNSTLIPVTRIEGVTRAFVAPLANDRVFAGQGALIHLGSGPDLLVKRRAALFAVLGPVGSNLERYRRPTAWAAFREALDDARDYFTAKDAYKEGRYRDQRTARIEIEALEAVVRGEEPLVVWADRESDIRQVVAYGRETGLRIIIYGGGEAWQLADELVAAGVPVLIDPEHNLPTNFANLGATLANAARLDAAGVKVAFTSASEQYAHNARRMGQLAGNAVANGMPRERALAAITRNPAEIFGIGDSYGTLEPGKDADVVIWDGDPLEVTSAPVTVFIRGERIPMESRQKLLRDRYRDLSRTDPPFAYR